MSEKVLKMSSLWVTVWSQEGPFQHNQFLGETCISFEFYEFENPLEERTYKLEDYSKMDMVPNPNFPQRQNTIIRVRVLANQKEARTPTLSDLSVEEDSEPEPAESHAMEDRYHYRGSGEFSAASPTVNVDKNSGADTSDKVPAKVRARGSKKGIESEGIALPHTEASLSSGKPVITTRKHKQQEKSNQDGVYESLI